MYRPPTMPLKVRIATSTYDAIMAIAEEHDRPVSEVLTDVMLFYVRHKVRDEQTVKALSS